MRHNRQLPVYNSNRTEVLGHVNTALSSVGIAKRFNAHSARFGYIDNPNGNTKRDSKAAARIPCWTIID